MAQVVNKRDKVMLKAIQDYIDERQNLKQIISKGEVDEELL